MNYWAQINYWKNFLKFWYEPLWRNKWSPSPLLNVAAKKLLLVPRNYLNYFQATLIMGGGGLVSEFMWGIVAPILPGILQTWSQLLKKSLMENFIFYSVQQIDISWFVGRNVKKWEYIFLTMHNFSAWCRDFQDAKNNVVEKKELYFSLFSSLRLIVYKEVLPYPSTLPHFSDTRHLHKSAIPLYFHKSLTSTYCYSFYYSCQLFV